MKAVKGSEIIVTVENKVGELAEIAQLIKDNNINILAISAWVIDDNAFFRLIASNNTRAKEILQTLGDVDEKEIVIVDMPDEVGQLFMLASRLKDNNIDLDYIHGTTSEPGKATMVVFSSSNNDKAIEVLTQ